MPRALVLAIAGAWAVALSLTLHLSGALDRLEHDAVDARFAVRDRHEPPRDVTVVGLDADSLAQLGIRFPPERGLQARVLNGIRRAHPRLIVYDVSLTEGTVPASLVDAIYRARPVVLGAAETDERGGTRVLGTPGNVRSVGAVVGNAQLPEDADGVVRKVEGAPNHLPAIAVRVAQLTGHGTPLRGSERAWIDWVGKPGTVPRHSWADAVNGRLPSLRGKVVVVGYTSPRFHDVQPTAAGGPAMPGPEVQANAIETLLRGEPLTSPAGWIDALLVALCALLVPALAVPFGMKALIVAPVALAALAGGAQALFGGGTVIAVAGPATAIVLGAIAAGTALLGTEVLARRRLRTTFARFVPPEIVDVVADRADGGAGLPSEELDATVMFCDLRGFTTYAEGRPAQEVIGTLNRYLTEMSDAVLAHGGTVVAYLGDGMMSVFGAPIAQPDHADRALAAAREMAGPRLAALNASLAERGIDQEFALGVGLNSGTVMSGTVGSARRMEYAAVGDTTNVAARVQALTKEHGGPILMTGATHERLASPDGVGDPVGETPVRGRDKPVELFRTG